MERKAPCPGTPPFVSGLCLGTCTVQGSSLILSGASGPVIYPVGGPDAGQWSIELFCLPSELYHRDYSSVHLQVRVLGPPNSIQVTAMCASFTLRCSLFPDQLWALEASPRFPEVPSPLRAFMCFPWLACPL